MKLSKPEYNENVTDVDGLEKLRIQQVGETERHLTAEQELTKREKVKAEQETKRHDNYLYRTVWIAVPAGLATIAMAVAGYNVSTNYIDFKKSTIQAAICPPPPACAECPKVSCQAVPVK